MPEDTLSETAAPKTTTTKTRAIPKPKAVQRKSKAEREEHARKEAERAKERQTSDATATPKTAARGGRGAARGGRGAIKQNERSTVTAGAGVFGAGRGERPDRARGPIDLGVSEAIDGYTASHLDVVQTGAFGEGSGGSGGGGGGGGGSGGGGGGGRGRGGKQDADAFIPEDEDVEDLGRRDIERIWISSDEEEDAIVSRKGKQRQVSRPPKPGIGLRPVRAARTVVEEDPEEHLDKKKVKKTSNDNAVIDVDTDEMQIDEVSGAVKKDLPPSPELTKRALRKSDSKPKETRILTETMEERAERLRLNEDVEGLRDAFIHKSDTDDTLDSKEEEAVFGQKDHNRMFLFQLPPLVPQLYDSNARPPQDTEAMEVDQENVQVKTEPGTTVSTIPKEVDKGKTNTEPPPQIFTAESQASQRLSSGLVGKLKIHKSGKVTLDWGGTDMEVRYGTEVDFLQDVICVENPEPEPADENGHRKEQTGKVYALGQVHKKMVLIPDWSKLYA